MSVYKEGFHLIHNLKKHPVIYKGDRYWKNLQQLIKDYGVAGTREQRDSPACTYVAQKVKLYSEGEQPRLFYFRIVYRSIDSQKGQVIVTALPGSTIYADCEAGKCQE